MQPIPRSPESSARLSTAETNPLPNVSSARAWSAIALGGSSRNPRLGGASPVIREKAVAPVPVRRIRADGTEEICVEDILVIVPGKAKAAPAVEELGDDDLVVEEFRPAAYSVHATQEILADDVLAVADAPAPPVLAVADAPAPPARDERPSTVPWTVDNPLDEFEFPQTQTSQMSGPHAAVRRITNYSATQVFRRRSTNVKVVAASIGLALSLVAVAGIAKLATPTAAADGPVGISMRSPKKLDKVIRARTLAFGTAPHLETVAAISIDSLPPSRPARRRR